MPWTEALLTKIPWSRNITGEGSHFAHEYSLYLL